MGKGIDLAREAGSGVHAEFLDDFKDQLLIVMAKRLAKNGVFDIPLTEMDDTGQDLFAFSIENGVFHFEIKKKV